MNQIFKNKQTKKNIPKQFQNNKHEVTSVVQFPELPSFSPSSCPGSPASSIIQRQANQNTGKSKLSISLSKNGCLSSINAPCDKTCRRFRPPLPPSCYGVICYGAPRTKMQAKQFQVLPDVKQMAQATDMMHESAPWWLVPSLDYYYCTTATSNRCQSKTSISSINQNLIVFILTFCTLLYITGDRRLHTHRRLPYAECPLVELSRIQK